ncbi:MAG TPA: matrixin family metalloprotease [Aggregatilineales bacterium]|nr:matrixin family metalloprotease [Aggregatilineales bacterium]
MIVLIALSASPTRAATSLKYSQPATGSLNAGQTADYTFDGKAGDKPVIAMNTHNGSMVPHVALYDPQGRLIGEDSNGGGKGNALLKGTVLAADGTYKAQARNNAQSGTGTFSLVISEEKHQVGYEGPKSAQTSTKEYYQLATPWNHTNITYQIVNTPPKLNGQDVRAVIAQAFQGWANVTPLKFTETSGQADITVDFQSIDGPLNILGETCMLPDPCGGQVTFDSDENWTLGAPQGDQTISLLGVASHELGHAIGMLHTTDANALMYPEYSPYVLQPTADDIAGVQRLYGPGAGRVSNPTVIPGLPNVTAMPAGQMQVSGQLDNTKFVHFWDFDVQAGDTVTITMRASAGDLDPFLIIVDANNHVIAYDDDSGGGKDAQVRNLKFSQGGTYSVAATRFSQAQGNTTGTYTLSIQYGP